MTTITITPLSGSNVHGLKPITLHAPKPNELSEVIRSYACSGVPYKLVYGSDRFRHSIAPSFTSR